jgi:myo-inositol catabolism protein IolC
VALGYHGRLYLLALDHRTSFERMLGVDGSTPEGHARIAEAKSLIYRGFRIAVEGRVAPDEAGILVDSEYGAEVARAVRDDGHPLAIAVERSGRAEFELEHGDGFAAQVESFDPQFVKVLVRYNAEGDRDLNRRQSERLRGLSTWVHEHGRKLLFELLVPPNETQLARVGGDRERYDAVVRPELMLRAISELRQGGVEVDIWKIEGLDDRSHTRAIAERVREGGRDEVGCVMLGRGESADRVESWIRAAAGVPGYVGFAIGRSIFADAVLAADATDEQRAATIAERYARFVQAYQHAEQTRGQPPASRARGRFESGAA